jgi:hypothetical protein
MPRNPSSILDRLLKPKKPAHAAPAERAVIQSRLAGTAAAYRRMASLLLAAQLLLWLMLTADGPGAQTLWQSAALLVPAALGAGAVSRLAWGGQTLRRRWELLLLWLCLTGDGILLLHSLIAVLHRMMPSYPGWILRTVIPVMLIAGVLLGRKNGAAYGIGLWRWMLPLFLLPALWQSLTANGFDRLYPLLGHGLPHTVGLASGGLGAVWPAALLFTLPPPMPSGMEKGKRGLGYTLVPMAGLCLCGLALCCAAPWLAGGGSGPGELILRLGRSCTIPAAGLYALFWMLLLMLGFCGVLHSGRRLAAQVFPGLKGWITVWITALPPLAAVWCFPEELPPWLTGLMPWRLLLWGAAAVWGLVQGRRKRITP